MKGLYIHIPFCVKKCRYCDFTSFADKADCFDLYVKQLMCEMEQYRGEGIDTVLSAAERPPL